MAVYRVYSGATGAANGSSWTDAYTTFAAGLAACTVAGDEVWLASDHNEQLAVDTTYTVPSVHVHANPLKAYSVSRADDTLAGGAFIGHDTLNRSIAITGAGTSVWLHGITLQIAGTGADNLIIGLAARQTIVMSGCKLYLINTSASSSIRLGSTSASSTCRVITYGCEMKFGNAGQGLPIRSYWQSYGDTLSVGPTHPTVFISQFDNNGGAAYIEGGDLSNFSTILNNVGSTTAYGRVDLVSCKMKSGFQMLNATPGDPFATEIFLRDCSAGDEHYHIGYANYYGAMLVEAGIYANDAITTPSLSWKVTTTANASYATPFVTPWISAEHSGTISIAPYLECLRSGSATAFTDAEVWAETMAKVTAGSTRSTLYTDRVAPRSTAANQAASSKTASDWTGGHASSNWFGKLGQSNLTPAEAGFLRMRVCVGVASQTLYVDPQIRI